MESQPLGRPVLPPAELWRYRIEGAQKMVFAFNSKDFAPQILALFPVLDELPLHPPSPHPQALIARHLSPFLLPARQIRLESDYLAQLAEIAGPFRPPHRSTFISAEYPYATLHPDAALHFGPHTTLVELKPKHAHLSRSRLIPPHQANALRKYTTPTYHIKNYLLPHGRLPRELYQPADLLSTDVSRIIDAIHILRQEHSRSLRVFDGGNIVDPEHYPDALVAAAHALVADNHCSEAVLALQAYDSLDNAGAEVILRRLVTLVGETEANNLVRHELYRESPQDADSDILCYASSDEASVKHGPRAYAAAVEAAGRLSSEQCVRLLSKFLQAAAAKDCSLLVALCRTSDVKTGKGSVIATQNGEWMFRIWAVDVGEKAISKIRGKWAPEDRRRAKVLEARGSSR